MMRMLVMSVLGAMAAAAHAQHDHGHHGEGEAAGSWSEFALVLPAGSAWGTEQCFYLDGDHVVTWKFDAAEEVNINFHLHPERGGEYHTVYLRREDGVRSGEGSVETTESGAYCFEFNRTGPPAEDVGISLRYRLD